MGDIISILKHAREVHAQSEREKMASQMSTTEVESESHTLPSMVTPPNAQTPAGTTTPPGSKRKATGTCRGTDTLFRASDRMWKEILYKISKLHRHFRAYYTEDLVNYAVKTLNYAVVLEQMTRKNRSIMQKKSK